MPQIKTLKAYWPSVEVSAWLLHRSVFLLIDALIFTAAIWRCNAIQNSFLIGLGLMGCGLSLRLSAAISRFERGVPSIIGIYRYLRAPYLLGSTMIWLGAAIAARDFSLMLAVLSITAVWGGWLITAAERRGLRSEQFVRVAYLRDVPMLVPQLLPFTYSDSILAVNERNRLLSRSGMVREWPVVLLSLTVLLGFWCIMRYLSMHREIAGACTFTVFVVVAYRWYGDFVKRGHEESPTTLRF